MSDRTVVLAATNLLSRGALLVSADRKAPTGMLVHGLFAVARAVQHVIDWKAPTRAVAIVERDPSACSPLLAPQRDALPALLRDLGITVVEGEGEPHLVGSYAHAALASGDDVVVVGIDKRLAQLVGERSWWYDANKNVRYTEEIVRKRFGVGPAQVADWLALVGDDDQVPGVSGIGAKGATQLLSTHETVEAAVAALASLDTRTRKALDAARDELPAHLARARLDLARPLPMPLSACAYIAPEPSRLNATLSELGFVELLVSTEGTVRARVCTTAEELGKALQVMGEATISVQALIEDDDPRAETLVGIALSVGDGQGWYVPADGDAWDALVMWLEDRNAAKAGHDLVGLLVLLRRQGVHVNGIVADSACASHLTQPSEWAPHELPLVARHVLGRSLQRDDEVRGVGKERKTWRDLPGDLVADIASERADASSQISRSLSKEIDASLMREYLELSDTLVRMELSGIAIDLSHLDRTEATFAEIEGVLQAEIDGLAGHAFNINSSAQLGKVLFDELKLPVVLRTKTGFSTSNEALERIEHAHPIVARVLRWRRLRRLRDSWVSALRRCVHADGRVHSRFHLARSFSGELVNTDPDLGRVPGATPEMAEIRRAFVAPPGRLLMSVDYSQLGLYVLAHLTKDPALVEPLRTRADVHRLTAAAVLDKAPDAVTLAERQLGKVVNFATFAGQGASALALQLGVDAAEAKRYIARFDQHYALVRAFQDEQLRLAKERGYLVTLAGRRWPIGGLASSDSKLRSYAERLARRGTHEGSVADVSRRALLEADRALRRSGLSAVPLVEVVDEIVFEVDESELTQAAALCSDAMTRAFTLEVPLVVGVEAGKNWADLEPIGAQR